MPPLSAVRKRVVRRVSIRIRRIDRKGVIALRIGDSHGKRAVVIDRDRADSAVEGDSQTISPAIVAKIALRGNSSVFAAHFYVRYGRIAGIATAASTSRTPSTAASRVPATTA